MTHTFHLKAVEAELYDVPHLYFTPVWAHRDTLEQPLSIPFGTPFAGVADIALRINVDWSSGLLVSCFVAIRSQPTMMDLNAIQREMKATQAAMTKLQGQTGARVPTIGEKCAAWCEAFDMPGVLLPRYDHVGVRLCRRVRSAVDRYVEGWEAVAREELLPGALQVEAMAEAAELTR